MDTDSLLLSIAMLQDVVNGKTYEAVAAAYGLTRTAIERRVKTAALRLFREAGIDGINEDGLAFVQRLRACRTAITAAIQRYEPRRADRKRVGRILSDQDIEMAIQRTRQRSPCAQRDVALLCVLLTTGARPLEIARLEVRDYLEADGSVREESVMRSEVAVNRRSRPLFFASDKVREAMDRYLTDRTGGHPGVAGTLPYRGLAPDSRLFLTEKGMPFEIHCHGAQGQRRFLCRGILDTYRKIFRRIGLPGASALSVRRTVANRLYERGAAEDQIGEILGISEKKSVRELLPRQRQPLQSVVRGLV
ncbi:site-specific integrase [Noviherbaspirillum sedimenti]|uniref:Site-specific integrase n=1 Tax=Noviherbaspirillum sedimenti TaxID=2320865 RepID=A0A3A3FWR2_9BURK|nr:site-specific integrase [Noviherbaspirillum sedimenti]RJG00587.1 site-specific integrase [Noviherbaspirillum sedimenti]